MSQSSGLVLPKHPPQVERPDGEQWAAIPPQLRPDDECDVVLDPRETWHYHGEWGRGEWPVFPPEAGTAAGKMLPAKLVLTGRPAELHIGRGAGDYDPLNGFGAHGGVNVERVHRHMPESAKYLLLGRGKRIDLHPMAAALLPGADVVYFVLEGALKNDAVLDRPIRQLSRGNRQKIGIVQAFMHRPDVVVLDEPSAGLDPLLQGEMRILLTETATSGAAVFLSSHSLGEVQHVADRVEIIRSGRLVDVGEVESLRERSLRHVTITFADAIPASAFSGLAGVRVTGSEGTVVRLSAPEAAMDALVKTAARHQIVDFVAQPADLEEIFLELYREADDGG